MPFLKEKTKKTELIKAPDKDAGKMFHIGQGVRVLVVDDNPINLLLVEKILKKQSFETETADNGKTALDKFSKKDYDIILMDLQMPEMDGYDATIRIRNLNSDKKNVPIIAMTAHTIKGEMERCLEIGMNDYISKPFHVAELYEKIHLLVAKS
jgi:CheY-like chemotaxis protein